jgi:hypothetical protein
MNKANPTARSGFFIQPGTRVGQAVGAWLHPHAAGNDSAVAAHGAYPVQDIGASEGLPLFILEGCALIVIVEIAAALAALAALIIFESGFNPYALGVIAVTASRPGGGLEYATANRSQTCQRRLGQFQSLTQKVAELSRAYATHTLTRAAGHPNPALGFVFYDDSALAQNQRGEFTEKVHLRFVLAEVNTNRRQCFLPC